MPEPKIYFQWQNDFLLQTIYPLRETKLRDFLIYFHEIEIWKQYRTKTPAEIPGEVQAHCQAQKQKLNAAFDLYQELEAYFLNDDISAIYAARFPQPDPETLARITSIHKAFKQYFPKYNNPVKEKYFISERVRQGEALRKQIHFQISERQRVIRNMGPTWFRKPDYEKDIQRLSTLAIHMVEEELSRLYAFLAAYERLEKYKQELTKRKAALEKEKQEATGRIQALRGQAEKLTEQLAVLRQSTARLTNPPNYEASLAYFLTLEVTPLYQAEFPQPDPAVLLKIQSLHQVFSTYFPGYKNAVKERYFIGQRIQEFEELRVRKRQELADKLRAAAWISPVAKPANDRAIQELRAVSLPMIERELNRLVDLQWAFEQTGRPAQDYRAQIEKNQAEIAELERRLATAQQSEADQQAILTRLDTRLNIPLKEQIMAFMEPAYITVADVVRGHTERYRQELGEKDHHQLLELVVQELVSKPRRYPLWLQYMIIHFSGMRYQSAHGSWADPKSLLHALRSLDIQRELKTISEDAIAALCEQRFLCYRAARAAGRVLEDGSEQEQDIPPLAYATEPEWRARLNHHLRALDPAGGYYKRRALLDVYIDEEDYLIQRYTDSQALEALEDLKQRLPAWMWREIVRVTGLRLKEIEDANWEQLTPEDIADRYARGMSQYRDILVKWKSKHLTGWREEHDRTSQLIVSRAVCNEVAEHIQHIRGITPPGGLTAKPEWYMRKEKESLNKPGDDKPYFRKVRSTANLKPGASLFWTRWMNKQPNIWQITRPFLLLSGEEIIPQGADRDNRVWSTGSAYRRTVTRRGKDAFGNDIETTEEHWLRWMHEATIVEVAETVDGPTVLTFETALPTDDRRQATIGVFKHRAIDLNYNVSPSLMIGTFAGYIPEGQVPVDHLREMLDWNNILLRPAYTLAQIDRYWLEVAPPTAQPLSFSMDARYEAAEVQEAEVEVAPLVSLGRWLATLAYEPDPTGQAMLAYQPAVALKRGARLTINSCQPLTVDTRQFYPILRCESEPRAQDLYIEAAETIPVPESASTLPFRVREDLHLYQMCGLDSRGRPIFDLFDAHLAAGTRLRVSTIHPAGLPQPQAGTPSAPGAIRSGRQRYYLISDCPRVPSVEGLFILASQLRPISEKEYARKALALS